jgi:hypothetical protein
VITNTELTALTKELGVMTAQGSLFVDTINSSNKAEWVTGLVELNKKYSDIDNRYIDLKTKLAGYKAVILAEQGKPDVSVVSKSALTKLNSVEALVKVGIGNLKVAVVNTNKFINKWEKEMIGVSGKGERLQRLADISMLSHLENTELLAIKAKLNVYTAQGSLFVNTVDPSTRVTYTIGLIELLERLVKLVNRVKEVEYKLDNFRMELASDVSVASKTEIQNQTVRLNILQANIGTAIAALKVAIDNTNNTIAAWRKM